MYSYEERLRAVQLYIKLGKRIGLTIRQLGYPLSDAALRMAALCPKLTIDEIDFLEWLRDRDQRSAARCVRGLRRCPRLR